MTVIQFAILREAAKLRDSPDVRYRGWRGVVQAADQLFAEPPRPARKIPLTANERRQQEKRTGAALSTQKAIAKLREAGYRVSPPKTDEDLDSAAETWVQERHG